MPTSKPFNPNLLDPGITLRDLFAAAALVGIWACPQASDTHESIATSAYNSADAMLRAREEAPDADE
jgi:hypothetical protein